MTFFNKNSIIAAITARYFLRRFVDRDNFGEKTSDNSSENWAWSMGRTSVTGSRFMIQRKDAYRLFTYYRHLPKDVAPKVIGEVRCHWSGKIVRLEGKSLISISLGTSDRRDALLRRDLVHAPIEEIVQEAIRIVRQTGIRPSRAVLMRGLSPEQTKMMSDHIYARILALHDAAMVGTSDNMSFPYLDELFRGSEIQDASSELAAVTYLMETMIDPGFSATKGDTAFIPKPLTDRILGDFGVELIDDQERRMAALAIARAYRRAGRDIEARRKGQDIETPVAPRPVFDEKQERGPSVRQVFEEFAGSKLTNARTAQDYRVHVTRFVEIMGDLPVKAVTRKMVFDYATMMQGFPSRYPEHWRSRPALEVIELAKHEPTMKKLSNQTINDKALAALSSMFTWALDRELVEANPCAGVSLHVKKSPVKPRMWFEIEDLRTIFSQPEFTGKPEGSFFWIPMIALYSGMRLEEIGQLRCRDIRDYDGLFWSIDVTADGRETTVKTISSVRQIPVHRDLVPRLLAEKDRQLKAGSNWLFPDLDPDKFGKRTAAFSKRFGKFLTRIGIDDKRLVFHSFRHTFTRRCRHNKIPKDVAEQLTGHAEVDISDSYGGRTDPLTLNSWIQQLDWSPVFKTE